MWSWSELLVLGRAYSFTSAESLGNLYTQEILKFLEPAIDGDHPANALGWVKALSKLEDLPSSAEDFVSYYLDTRPEPRYAPHAFQIDTGRLLRDQWPGGELLFSWRGEYHAMGLKAVANLSLTLLSMSGLVDGTSSGENSKVSLDGYYTLLRSGPGHVRFFLEIAGDSKVDEDELDLPSAWEIPISEFSKALAQVIRREVESPVDQSAMHEWLTLALRRLESHA